MAAHGKHVYNYFSGLYSHIVLVIISVSYIFIGACVFKHLEQPLQHHFNDGDEDDSFLLGDDRRDNFVGEGKPGIPQTTRSPLIMAPVPIKFDSFFIKIINISRISQEPVYKLNITERISETAHHFSHPNPSTVSVSTVTRSTSTKTALRRRKRDIIPSVPHVHSNETDWTWPASVLFCFVTVSTIGYGNLSPVTHTGRLFCMIYGLIGIPLFALCLRSFSRGLTYSIRKLYHLVLKLYRKYRYSNETVEESVICSAEPLPFLLLMAFFILVIVLGGYFMIEMQDHWTYFDSFYFCVISLTTIGYGDIAPNAHKVIYTILYMTFGLTIATMLIEKFNKLFHQGFNLKCCQNSVQLDVVPSDFILYEEKPIKIEDLVHTFCEKCNLDPNQAVEMEQQSKTILRKLAQKHCSSIMAQKISVFSVENQTWSVIHA